MDATLSTFSFFFFFLHFFYICTSKWIYCSIGFAYSAGHKDGCLLSKYFYLLYIYCLVKETIKGREVNEVTKVNWAWLNAGDVWQSSAAETVLLSGCSQTGLLFSPSCKDLLQTPQWGFRAGRAAAICPWIRRHWDWETLVSTSNSAWRGLLLYCKA